MTRLFHLHIRKTAGTALRRPLTALYDKAVICPYRSDVELFAKAAGDVAATLEPYDFVSGHFYRVAAHAKGYQFITVLRNPFDRVVSAYNHIAADQSDPLHSHLGGASLVEALTKRKLAPELWNGQTRALTLASGRNYDALTDPQRLDAALEFLEGCTVVGFQENMDGVVARLEQAFGVDLAPVGLVNTKITSSGVLKSDAVEFVREIMKKNALDMFLYGEAMKRFGFKVHEKELA